MASLFRSRGSDTLRKQLFLWVTIPMFVLIPLDTSILYKVGIHFVNQSFDDSMEDMANDVVAMINESGRNPETFSMSKETEGVLFSNQYDKTYYAIYNATGKLLSGNLPLPFRVKNLSKSKCFKSSVIQHERVRLLTVKSVHLGLQQKAQPYFVVIAETLHKRHNLRSRILLAIVLPQIILMIVCGAMLLWSVTKGLEPLHELNEEIAKRSSTQLDPVMLKNVPEEAMVLINSINLLMGRLRNAILAQNQFIADAAHQLRTPIAGIQAQVEVALKQERTRPLVMISESVFKLTHLVNQLLRLSHNQPEAANVIELVPVNLFTLAQETCAEVIHFALQKHIDLGFESSSRQLTPDFEVFGDSQRLKVMLLNLLDNAIRYTPDGGKVTLALTALEDCIELRVEDNGVGIPENEHEMIFERFHRVLDNSQEGSGLGLSIVKEIAILHGADIAVASAGKGAGTIMTVRFNRKIKPSEPQHVV